MVQITLDNIVPSTPPANGWIVKYRIKGTTGAYTTAVGSPFSSFPIVFSTTDAAGTLYEGTIQDDCGYARSTTFAWITPCTCVGSGYTPTVDGTQCGNTTTIGATVTNSGYCLATSTNGAYSNYGSRIYNPGFSLSTILLSYGASDTYIYGNMNNNPQWANPALNTTSGPMNREGVWIDTNCDGNKDPLADIIVLSGLPIGSGGTNGTYSNVTLSGGSGTGAKGNVVVSANEVVSISVITGTGYLVGDVLTVASGDVGGTTGVSVTISSVSHVKTTVAAQFNNVGISRTVYVGIGGDNQFKLVVNGTIITDTGSTVSSNQFKIWHVIPVVISTGLNYFNVIATGDGSVNDSIAMVIYDNTAAQLISSTSDSALNILFKTSNLRGTTFDVATCPTGYSLDSSGGSGSYVCTKTTFKICNSIS